MRTLLIAPSFLTAFAGAIVMLGLLISCGAQTASEANAFPPPHAFTSWSETMPQEKKVVDPSKAAARESVDELEYY